MKSRTHGTEGSTSITSRDPNPLIRGVCLRTCVSSLGTCPTILNRTMSKHSFSVIAITLLIALGFVSGCTSSRTSQAYGSGSLTTTLDIVNNTNSSIFYLYLSSCSSNSWGADQLGSDVIAVGTTYSFRMTPGCWDLRAKLRDGREVDRRGVNMRPGDRKSWTLS